MMHKSMRHSYTLENEVVPRSHVNNTDEQKNLSKKEGIRKDITKRLSIEIELEMVIEWQEFQKRQ